MTAMGLTPPSIASLGRIFREAGVARAEPNKKPRSAFRRFTYPAPNACWQMDGTEAPLADGSKCVIFQLEDDHSRREVASHVACSENTDAAIRTLDKGIQNCGVPQRLLTDNGAALNPTRRGWSGRLVTYAKPLGIDMITGKPYKPTTQGKNERLHQTLFRWLDTRPLPGSIPEMQALVDEFDHVCNTQRPHQALPGRMTPQQAWDATPVAAPPQPPPTPPAPPSDSGTTANEPANSTRSVSSRSAASNSRSPAAWPTRRSTPPGTPSASPSSTSTVRSSPNTPGHPKAPPTSPTADPQDDHPDNNRHRSPDTTTVTEVLIQNCHRSPETSHATENRRPCKERPSARHGHRAGWAVDGSADAPSLVGPGTATYRTRMSVNPRQARPLPRTRTCITAR